jgi:hypothetical protein
MEWAAAERASPTKAPTPGPFVQLLGALRWPIFASAIAFGAVVPVVPHDR